jgi:hypothetical protein
MVTKCSQNLALRNVHSCKRLIMNCLNFSRYTPPLMKKVIDKYFDMLDLNLKQKFEIWSFTLKVIAWVAKLLN